MGQTILSKMLDLNSKLIVGLYLLNNDDKRKEVPIVLNKYDVELLQNYVENKLKEIKENDK